MRQRPGHPSENHVAANLRPGHVHCGPDSPRTAGLILPALRGTQQEWLHQLQWVWDQALRPQSKILEPLDSPERRLINTRESQSHIRPCGFGLTLPPEQNHSLGQLGGTGQHRHILKTGLATETHRPKPASAQTQRHIVCYP